MRPSIALLAAALGAIALAGCANDEYGYGYGPSYGGGYYGYYDGYYGNFAGGYWGPSGVFYYYDAGRHRYERDSGHHFRHDAAPGYQRFQGQAPQRRDHNRNDNHPY